MYSTVGCVRTWNGTFHLPPVPNGPHALVSTRSHMKGTSPNLFAPKVVSNDFFVVVV